MYAFLVSNKSTYALRPFSKQNQTQMKKKDKIEIGLKFIQMVLTLILITKEERACLELLTIQLMMIYCIITGIITSKILIEKNVATLSFQFENDKGEKIGEVMHQENKQVEALLKNIRGKIMSLEIVASFILITYLIIQQCF